MPPAKLQVDCSSGPKPQSSAWRPCLEEEELSSHLILRLTPFTNDVGDLTFVHLFMCVCVCVGGERGGGADGRGLVITSGILYSVVNVEGSILVKATLSQFR